MVRDDQVEHRVTQKLKALIAGTAGTAMRQRTPEQVQVARLISQDLTQPRLRPIGLLHAGRISQGGSLEPHLLGVTGEQAQMQKQGHRVLVVHGDDPGPILAHESEIVCGRELNAVDIEVAHHRSA